MHANLLLKHNIDGLLRARHLNRKDLAMWCRRSESWISQIFRSDKRELPLHYLDRIADFFGLKPYQLFQPGVVGIAERRQGERRQNHDRRVGYEHRLMVNAGVEVDRVRRQVPHAPSSVQKRPPSLRQSFNGFDAVVDAREAARQQTAAPRPRAAGSPPRHRSLREPSTPERKSSKGHK